MFENSAAFSGNIPDYYNRALVPVMFADFAADIARRTASASPSRVLETAAGTGIVTRQLRDQLPAHADLLATDLNPPMLDVARTRFKPDEAVGFQQADGTALPFPDSAFDTVVCQFGVMFYPDKDKAYREVYRVLSRGGRYLFNVWDSHRYNPFARLAQEVVTKFFPHDPPGFYQVPFGYHEIDPIKESLLNAGFTGITVSVLSRETQIPDLDLYANGLVYGNPLGDQVRQRGGVDPEEVVAEIKSALEREFGATGLRMPLQAIVFEASKA
jgi:SAM-dependent methyltransferase